MAYIHSNILSVGGTPQKLYGLVESDIVLTELTLTNINDTQSCLIDLFLYGSHTSVTGQRFYIIKNLTLFKGTSIQFDSSDIGYDNKLYDLYIQLRDSSSKLDVKLKTT
jgi:hypothetical protein